MEAAGSESAAFLRQLNKKSKHSPMGTVLPLTLLPHAVAQLHAGRICRGATRLESICVGGVCLSGYPSNVWPKQI